MKIIICSLLSVLFGVSVGVASEKTLEAITPCLPSSYVELVKCAEKNSMDIKIAEQQLQSATKLEEVALQWLNPELEAESVWKGSEKSETTAALLFTLRLGGKKSALINEAKSEIQKAHADRDLSVNQARLEIILSLYKLSHLRNEIQLEEESGDTFAKIINQYEKRAAHSPEQNVSLNMFKMALADHKLKLTRLKTDENRLMETFVALTGIPKKAIEKNLPGRKEIWPVAVVTAEINSSPQMRKVLAELKVAQSQNEKAEGEAWPDLKIGPTVRTTKDGNENSSFVGLGLSMPLPIFSTNEGQKSYRLQKVIEAELSAEQAKKKLQALRSSLQQQYIQLVASLKATLSVKSLNEKHEQIEKQFFKGLVPSSLVIEAHRQLFDLEERRNESELQALESYSQILIIDNKFTEVIL